MTMDQVCEWTEKGLRHADPLHYRLAVAKLTREAEARGLTYAELLSVARGENG